MGVGFFWATYIISHNSPIRHIKMDYSMGFPILWMLCKWNGNKGGANNSFYNATKRIAIRDSPPFSWTVSLVEGSWNATPILDSYGMRGREKVALFKLDDLDLPVTLSPPNGPNPPRPLITNSQLRLANPSRRRCSTRWCGWGFSCHPERERWALIKCLWKVTLLNFKQQ